jgi:hypothetical protein
VSLLGRLGLQRGYHHCGHRGGGRVPWDERLRLWAQRLTPAAAEVVTLVGIQESFGKAAERTLTEPAGVRPSESTGERVTEGTPGRGAAGRRGARHRAGVGLAHQGHVVFEQVLLPR